MTTAKKTTTPQEKSKEDTIRHRLSLVQDHFRDTAVVKKSQVKSRDNKKLYSYANLNDLMQEIVPVLKQHKVRFSQDFDSEGNLVTTFSREEDTDFANCVQFKLPAGQLMVNKKDHHDVVAGITYARRYALILSLGIITRDDDDQRIYNANNPKAPATAPTKKAVTPHNEVGELWRNRMQERAEELSKLKDKSIEGDTFANRMQKDLVRYSEQMYDLTDASHNAERAKVVDQLKRFIKDI